MSILKIDEAAKLLSVLLVAVGSEASSAANVSQYRHESMAVWHGKNIEIIVIIPT